jgi:hypothetical protein
VSDSELTLSTQSEFLNTPCHCRPGALRWGRLAIEVVDFDVFDEFEDDLNLEEIGLGLRKAW